VPVSHPEIFWFGTRGDVNWFADPADGRYDGAVELRWDRMVEPLTQITDAIRAGDWANRSDGDSVVPVEISRLTLDEESTILDLFSGRPIEVDPWETELTDGRHRTWGFWNHDPAIVLPFVSRLLGAELIVDDRDFTSERLAPMLRADHRAEAVEQLPGLPAGVAARSPRYMDALTQLAQAPDLGTRA
jgi:hypothetical protein